jgi:hypothetical protein
MIMHILAGTPKWVFVLFFALLWMGLQQLLPRSVSLNRATIVPLVMTGLSLYGVTSAFGDSGQALLAWIAGAVVAFTISLNLQNASPIRFDAHSRRFEMPGSAVPLVLFMGIFFTKYVVGVSIGMQPSLAHDSNFALAVSALYGAFSGVFLTRAAKLWRLALSQNTSLQTAR